MWGNIGFRDFKNSNRNKKLNWILLFKNFKKKYKHDNISDQNIGIDLFDLFETWRVLEIHRHLVWSHTFGGPILPLSQNVLDLSLSMKDYTGNQTLSKSQDVAYCLTLNIVFAIIF